MHLKHLFNELHYEIVRTVAEGGMGFVCEAVQHGAGPFRKRVAIKLIHEEYSQIEEFRDNFVGEARLVADLIHTNIVQTYHLGKVGEQYFMVMEYVDGITLEQFYLAHLKQHKKIPVDLAAFMVSRVCRGLSYAHRKLGPDGQVLGIVHRDVNPRNVLIGKEGDVKLTDFGIAKARDLMYNIEGEVIAGKDEYLSPEQVNRKITDARADLFCCGIVLLELLIGKNFFEGRTARETHGFILEKTIPDCAELNSDIPPELNDIIHRALERDREARYQSADDMLVDLETYLYSGGYGPTNEKLSSYMGELMPELGIAQRTQGTAIPSPWEEQA